MLSALSAVTPIPLASNGSATETGSLSTAVPSVAYSFVSPITGMLAIREVPTGSSLYQTAVSVYDSSQNPLATLPGYSYSVPAGSLTTRVVINATQGSTYYAVASAAGGAVGAYSLQITPDAGSTPALATNINLISNGASTVVGSATQFGQIYYPGDTNVYKFTAVVPGASGTQGVMTISMNAGQSSSLDSFLDVYDANYATNTSETPLAENDDYGGSLNSQVSFTVTSGNVYYIKASSFNGATVGAYQLQLSTAMQTDTDPYANTFAAADANYQTNPNLIYFPPVSPTLDSSGNVISTSATITSAAVSGTVVYPGDADIIRFAAPVTGTMAVTLNPATGSSLSPYVSIYDGNQNLLVSNVAGGATVNPRVTFSAQAGATYYVKAAGFGNSTGAYTLALQDTWTQADDFPQMPPFTASNPATVVAVDPITGYGQQMGTVDYVGDQDWFSVSVPQGSLTVQESALSGGLVPQVLGLYAGRQRHAGDLAFQRYGQPHRNRHRLRKPELLRRGHRRQPDCRPICLASNVPTVGGDLRPRPFRPGQPVVYPRRHAEPRRHDRDPGLHGCRRLAQRDGFPRFAKDRRTGRRLLQDARLCSRPVPGHC